MSGGLLTLKLSCAEMGENPEIWKAQAMADHFEKVKNNSVTLKKSFMFVIRTTFGVTL